MLTLFQLVSKFCEHASAVITSDLDFAVWSAVIGAAKRTIAQLERLTHQCHIVETGNAGDRVTRATASAKR